MSEGGGVREGGATQFRERQRRSVRHAASFLSTTHHSRERVGKARERVPRSFFFQQHKKRRKKEKKKKTDCAFVVVVAPPARSVSFRAIRPSPPSRRARAQAQRTSSSAS